MPAGYDTLVALLVGAGKPFPDERALDEALAELEDRGLLGWDKRANRYDLHPIVRGVAWGGMDTNAQQDVYGALHDHFQAIPEIGDWEKVERLEDLTPTIELYNTLIGLGRYEDAYIVFRDRLSKAMLYRLSASRQRIELLVQLFPDGLDALPRLSDPAHQAFTLNALAQGYLFSGQPGPAAPLYRLAVDLAEEENNQSNVSIGLCNLADALRLSGALHEAESAARRALVITRERADRSQDATSLNLQGLALAARGVAGDSQAALQRALRIDETQAGPQAQGVDIAYLSC